MKISSKQYARSLFDLSAGLSKEQLDELIKRFIVVLSKRHDLAKTDDIIKEFSSLLQKEEGEISAELVSARTLSAKTKNLITDYLADKIGANKVTWKERVDESLLGGFVLRYHGFVIDGSLKNNLNKFKKQLLIK